MAFVLITVRRSSGMWLISTSDKGFIEKIVSKDGAVRWVKKIYTETEKRPIELLVFDEMDELVEAWAIRDGAARDLHPILRRN